MSAPDEGNFAKSLNTLLEDAHRKLLAPEDGGWSTEIVVPEEIALNVRKLQAFVPVSCCFMTDSTGVNHCEHPPPPPVPWRRRLRYRLCARWRALRMRVGSSIAGVDLDREEDEW